MFIDGPAAQNAVVGGAKPFEVSRQLVIATVPIPVVEVKLTLLENNVGAAVGSVKLFAAIQIVTVPAAVLVICKVEPNVCASTGVPGEFEDAERSAMVMLPSLAEQVTGPVVIALVTQTVGAPAPN